MPDIALPPELVEVLVHAEQLLAVARDKDADHGLAQANLDAATLAEQQALAVAAVARQDANEAAQKALDAVKEHFGLKSSRFGWVKA